MNFSYETYMVALLVALLFDVRFVRSLLWVRLTLLPCIVQFKQQAELEIALQIVFSSNSGNVCQLVRVFATGFA